MTDGDVIVTSLKPHETCRIHTAYMENALFTLRSGDIPRVACYHSASRL